MQTFKSPFGNLIPFPTTSAEMDEYERMRRDYRPTHASQQSSNLPNVQGLNYGSYMQGQSNVDSSNYAGAHDPEGTPNVYSRGGYRDAYNNGLNDAMNVHGGLRNAQRESDVNNANRALDKWRTDIANEKKAKKDKAKKIDELQKWLAEHKDEYLTAKKWIARYNDPVFQGLNRKGIDSGDFSGLANYVQQQDDNERSKGGKQTTRTENVADARKAINKAVGIMKAQGSKSGNFVDARGAYANVLEDLLNAQSNFNTDDPMFQRIQTKIDELNNVFAVADEGQSNVNMTAIDAKIAEHDTKKPKPPKDPRPKAGASRAEQIAWSSLLDGEQKKAIADYNNKLAKYKDDLKAWNKEDEHLKAKKANGGN